MTRVGALVLAGAALATSVVRGGPPQGGPPMVVLDAVVSGPPGAVTTGLTAADFEVVSDSRVQTITFVSSDPQVLSAVWLVDVSASAKHTWQTSASEVATALARALRPGDRARLGGVAATITIGPWATEQADLGRAATSVLMPSPDDQYGPSPIWDATDTALEALAAEPGRRTIVWFTDGRATGNVHGLDEVCAHAAALGVSVNVVGLARVTWTGASALMLQQLAATSGGLSLFLLEASPLALSAVADRVMSDVRGGYRLGFVPDRLDGAVHHVTVRVKVPAFLVRTREQYVAASVR
jgi:VWFA-related protein